MEQLCHRYAVQFYNRADDPIAPFDRHDQGLLESALNLPRATYGGKDLALILKLHSILMNAIRADAGKFRQHGVRIMGTYVPTANFQTVPTVMKELDNDMQGTPTDQVAHLAIIHSRFEQIHPFSDGNGRVGRLLMHAMALQVNLAPVVVRQERKKLYTTYLNKAQMPGDSSLLEDLVCEAIMEGYRIVEREEPKKAENAKSVRPEVPQTDRREGK